jgi:hypothetical protein
MRQNLTIIVNDTSRQEPTESVNKDTGFRFVSAGVVPSSRIMDGQFCSLIGELGSDQVLGRCIRIGNVDLREGHMRLLAFRKVNVEREAFCFTVPTDAGSSTVPINRPTYGPFEVSKVVTVTQGFGRLSNIHGQSVSFTGHESKIKFRPILVPQVASGFSLFRRNQGNGSADFRLDNDHSESEQGLGI